MSDLLTIIHKACIQLLLDNGWSAGMHDCGSYFKGRRQINVNKEDQRLMVLFDNKKHIHTVTIDNIDNGLVTYFIES
jgi:predicted RNA binding protein YcfA (HicA-like mRNA interferase family)